MRLFVAKNRSLRNRLLPFALPSTCAILALVISGFAQAQTTQPVTHAAATNQAPFQLKVTSNLVVVRVVVRDAERNPVVNLKKEDFEVFDRGKKQSISQFAPTEASEPILGTQGVNGRPPNPAAPGTALPQRFLALYFDDLNTSDANLMQARDAADRYLATRLQPGDRVSIFVSGKSLTDFTNDPQQIHDALFQLHASPLALALAKNQDCPELSDYQAQQITEYEWDENIDAWKIALDQARNDAKCMRVPVGPGEPERYIVLLARKVVEQAQVQVRANLQALGQVVKYVSQMPGERTVLLISPGFLSRSEQPQLDGIIDRAVRAQVIVDSLDPKGLTSVTREGDVSHSYLPAAGAALGATQGLDSEREAAARDVLSQIAEETGGEFVHNTNDLVQGFGIRAGAPAYYLAFDPTDMKRDGRFHELKVELAAKRKGFSVQARRGYYAPTNEAKAESDIAAGGESSPEAEAHEEIREALLAKTEMQMLPVTMEAKVSATKTEARELVLSAHLDAKSLHFHKEGDRNLNTVTFVAAVFDQKDVLVQVQRGQAKLDSADAELQRVLTSGLKMDSTFELKPGVYRVREIVTESEEHRMTSISRTIDVSRDCCGPSESKTTSSPPQISQSISERESAASKPPTYRDQTGKSQNSPNSLQVPANAPAGTPTYLAYPLRKLMAAIPALNGMKPDASQEQLASILSKAGQATVTSLATIPNLTSREDVYSSGVSRAVGPANSILGMRETPQLLDMETQLRQTRSVEFNYLLLFDHQTDGATAIKELRTDFKNRPVNSPLNRVGPHGFGFAYQWLMLSPLNQPELRFRYLGQQKIDDHETFVLSFAQIPGQVKDPGKFNWAGHEASFYFQGIVWIDRSSFEVVRLRTDLLSPVPSVNLQQMTTELHFRSVHIHGFNSVLWLPSEVLILAQQSDVQVEELHEYSGYRFFHAESRVLP